MYNLIEYNDTYLKTLGSQCRQWDELALIDCTIVNFPVNCILFDFNENIATWTGNDGTRNDEIMEPLKNRNNFQRAPVRSLSYYGINPITFLTE